MTERQQIAVCTCGARNRVLLDRPDPRCGRCKQPLSTSSEDRIAYVYVITDKPSPIELTDQSTKAEYAYYIGTLTLVARDACPTDTWDSDAEFSGAYGSPTGSLDNLLGKAVRQFGAEILNRIRFRLEVRQLRGGETNADVLLVRSVVADEIAAFNDQLYELLLEAYEWGRANAHPRMREYPQYERVRKIGQVLHELFGLGGMQAALRLAREKASASYAYVGGFTALAEYAWDGIGGWRH